MTVQDAAPPLLRVESLRVRFATGSKHLTAVDDVSFEIRAGEVFGLVGESGCGKTVTCRSLIGLFGGAKPEATTGSIRFNGRELLGPSDLDWHSVRGTEIAMIFQDPMTSLNPTMCIGAQIAEGLREHRGLGMREARAATIELLASVGVTAPERRLADYPHSFSGGMRQRVLIAIALACRPHLLIADEPTTALDVTVQDQILKLILKLRDETSMGVLLVTHDLGVIAQTCDRVAVMYAGKIVETASARQLFARPSHPYTRALLNALPAHARRGERLDPIAGEPPNLVAPPSGCRFHPRCTFAIDACREVVPDLVDVEPGHRSACLRVGELG
jgi:peptide/nickel transport system ATP-binding protein/oligopeptide transport system ATP-binding protein